LIHPTSEIAPPPTRFAIALIPASPAAAALAGSHPDESAQNGPLNQYAPIRARLSIRTVGASWPVVRDRAPRPTAMRISVKAVCHRRSPVLSEWRPHKIMRIEATP